MVKNGRRHLANVSKLYIHMLHACVTRHLRVTIAACSWDSGSLVKKKLRRRVVGFHHAAADHLLGYFCAGLQLW